MSTPSHAATAVAVVTGGGRGIGRAVARRLAGAHAVLAVARTEAELRETAEGHPTIATLVADLADVGAVGRVAQAADALGTLRVWVNNAAVLEHRDLASTTDAQWRAIMAVDLDAVFAGCREALRRMAAGGGGTIINVASLSGVAAVEKFAGLGAYNVAKAGVIALSEAVALEGRDRGVRCVCVSPGAVDTEMLRRAAPHLRAGMAPDDMAALVDFLVSPAAAPLSGTNIPIHSNR